MPGFAFCVCVWVGGGSEVPCTNEQTAMGRNFAAEEETYSLTGDLYLTYPLYQARVRFMCFSHLSNL